VHVHAITSVTFGSGHVISADVSHGQDCFWSRDFRWPKLRRYNYCRRASLATNHVSSILVRFKPHFGRCSREVLPEVTSPEVTWPEAVLTMTDVSGNHVLRMHTPFQGIIFGVTSHPVAMSVMRNGIFCTTTIVRKKCGNRLHMRTRSLPWRHTWSEVPLWCSLGPPRLIYHFLPLSLVICPFPAIL
jgi:hypothetical protein